MLQDSTGETPGRGNGFTPSGYYESSRRLRRLLNKAASDDQKDAAAMSRITSTIATITCTRPKLGASRATNQAVTKADAESREQDHQHHRRSEEHTSELQSLMRISYAVFCLKKKTQLTESKKSIHTCK